MESTFFNSISTIGYVIESVGVAVIVVGSIWVTVRRIRAIQARTDEDQYRIYRHDLARVMMMGLEFLVAGDIIRTVVAAHTLQDISILGLVVVIRTVLVFTIHLELEGRWPWQQPTVAAAGAAEDDAG